MAHTHFFMDFSGICSYLNKSGLKIVFNTISPIIWSAPTENFVWVCSGLQWSLSTYLSWCHMSMQGGWTQGWSYNSVHIHTKPLQLSMSSFTIFSGTNTTDIQKFNMLSYRHLVCNSPCRVSWSCSSLYFLPLWHALLCKKWTIMMYVS